jgi:hypothetical protein
MINDLTTKSALLLEKQMDLLSDVLLKYKLTCLICRSTYHLGGGGANIYVNIVVSKIWTLDWYYVDLTCGSLRLKVKWKWDVICLFRLIQFGIELNTSWIWYHVELNASTSRTHFFHPRIELEPPSLIRAQHTSSLFLYLIYCVSTRSMHILIIKAVTSKNLSIGWQLFTSWTPTLKAPEALKCRWRRH